MNKDIRTLKVGYQPRQNVLRQINLVPALRLAGNWLLEAGFDYGDQVTVTVEKGKIIVEPA